MLLTLYFSYNDRPSTHIETKTITKIFGTLRRLPYWYTLLTKTNCKALQQNMCTK